MSKIPSIDLTNKSLLKVSNEIYTLKNIQNATYRFTGFASFNIFNENQIFIIEIESLPNADLTSEDVYHLLKNELISESLRQKIADETEVERNLILAYAFSNTALVN